MNHKKNNICPITYAPIKRNEKYSLIGLKKISPKLTGLNDLEYTADQQRKEALKRADKMSIQGIQPKLSAKLDIKNNNFQIVDKQGSFILKPQSDIYQQAPENEDLTMRMASVVGINVPLHGLIYCKDGSMTYFIKRFDRLARGKLAVEDFAQLLGYDRETKYKSSMEKVVTVIDAYCTFPIIEKSQLFLRTLVNYCLGNEDMHLKNFSLITDENKLVKLAPAYDFINSTIVLGDSKEELALPLNGKKRNLTSKDFIDYYGYRKLGLNKTIVEEQVEKIKLAIDHWQALIDISFLQDDLKLAYKTLLESRLSNLGFI